MALSCYTGERGARGSLCLLLSAPFMDSGISDFVWDQGNAGSPYVSSPPALLSEESALSEDSMAPVVPAARCQETLTLEDVTVNFTREEWGHLCPAERDLYKEVMLDTYKNLVSLGLEVSKADVTFLLERGKSPWMLESKDSSDSDSDPGEGVKNGRMGVTAELCIQGAVTV
ncbi:zinc finger protein 69 homolog isoform X3 [Sarcophilus harrisii]|uniref:zinc finger protein 69 homolog isoform X3 n=1 Tax=Sarcophilus harrisii TaxID=9305 RepID=UPI001301A8F2|nr:zinc finger protein 69 homolog isoform X3 [Sarcophilus harrisii]